MFEKASRLKIRFESAMGSLAVEDLWDLPLATGKVNLDLIAQGLNKALKDDGNVSFVTKSTKANTLAQLKFDIVKHIIDVRLAEKEAADNLRANAEKKKRILEILEERKDSSLRNASEEELQKMLESLT